MGNGLFAGGTRTIDGVAGGATADVRVLVSNADGSIMGVSSVFSLTLGGGGNPPASLIGLSAFVPFAGIADPIPEPSVVMLSLLAGAALFVRRRN